MPEVIHTPGRVLALNCGSSSLKFGVYDKEELLLEGEAEEIGSPASSFWWKVREKTESRQPITGHAAAFELVKRTIADARLPALEALGHRVVHGGQSLRDHFRLTGEGLRQLKQAVPFAPLHLPSSIEVIEACAKSMAHLPQVICLDTAFHRNLPDVAKTLAFPQKVRQLGVERYGFHGLSVESVVVRLQTLPKRLIVAHLGNGSSVTALLHGKSVDTSMGLTPSGGVMMGTRCGDVDPGVLLYLLRQGVDAGELEMIVDHESGLKGISGRTSDVRELSHARTSDSNCDLALRMFVYQVRKAIAGMAGALEGLDELVFTGGIGEHDEAIRAEITGGLAFLGPFEIRTLPSEEDLQIARTTRRILAPQSSD